MSDNSRADVPAPTSLGLAEFPRDYVETRGMTARQLPPTIDARALEALEAAIARINVILGSNADFGDDQVIRNEPALAKYLEGNRRPDQALALARGDVAFYRSLRENAWRQDSLARRSAEWARPVLLTIGSAVLLHFIATNLQDRSFENQSKFNLKKTLIESGRAEAMKCRAQADEFRWNAFFEDAQGRKYSKDEIQALTTLRDRIVDIIVLVEGLDNSAGIQKAVNEADSATLKPTIECMKAQMAPCREKFDPEQIQKIVDEFSVAMIKFLE